LFEIEKKNEIDPRDKREMEVRVKKEEKKFINCQATIKKN
jgi:hypothetical protein